METISPLIPPQNIGSATSGGGNKAQSGYQSQQGQIVQAKVTQILANSLFELDVGSQKILARSEAKLSAGQVLQLEVLKTSPEIELKIISPQQSQFSGKSLTLLHNNFDITNLFEQLGRSNNIPLGNLTKASQETLSQFIQLQNDSLGLKEDTRQVTLFIERFTTLLQASEKNPQQLLSQLNSSYKELADLMTQLPAVPQAETLAAVSLPDIKSPLAANIFELIQTRAQLLTTAGPQDNMSPLAAKVQELILSRAQTLTAATPQEISSPLTANINELLQSSAKHSDITQIIEQINAALGIQPTGALSNPPATIGTQLQNSIFSLLQQFTSMSSQTSSSLPGSYVSDQSVLGQKEGGQVLKQMIDNLGLRFEALLAKGKSHEAAQTLKAALYDIAQQFSNSKNVAEITNKILNTLELFQQVQLHFDSEKQIIVPLPLPFLEQGFLVVDKDDQEENNGTAEQKARNFSLYLSLKELGNMRIDFNNADAGINLRFNCESSEKAEFVSAHKEQLEQTITSVKLLSVLFTDKAADPASELLRKMVPEGQSILNTMI